MDLAWQWGHRAAPATNYYIMRCWSPWWTGAQVWWWSGCELHFLRNKRMNSEYLSRATEQSRTKCVSPAFCRAVIGPPDPANWSLNESLVNVGQLSWWGTVSEKWGHGLISGNYLISVDILLLRFALMIALFSQPQLKGSLHEKKT